MFAPTVTSVTLPEGLKYLALSSFAFCADLTWLDLPASLESLTPADAASENYLHLRLPEDSPYLTMEDGVLFDKAMETLLWFPRNRSGEYTLPETVKAIGTYAFCLCNIQSVTLPEGLLEIRAGAFYDCHQLETLSLPASLTTLTQESLLGCESLAVRGHSGGKPELCQRGRGAVLQGHDGAVCLSPGPSGGDLYPAEWRFPGLAATFYGAKPKDHSSAGTASKAPGAGTCQTGPSRSTTTAAPKAGCCCSGRCWAHPRPISSPRNIPRRMDRCGRLRLYPGGRATPPSGLIWAAIAEFRSPIPWAVSP